jgi:hypothetical protein
MRRTLIFLTLAILILVPGLFAAVCSNTADCTFTFDAHNTGPTNFGGGPYGTVELQLVGSSINFTINLASGFGLIGTGFPGTLGFDDNLAGALTFGSFSSSAYSGGNGGGAADGFDGFGSFGAAAATTTAPSAGDPAKVQSLSFTVSRTGGFSDVNQLVALSTNPPGGVQAYFVADVFQSQNCTEACTGLIAVTRANIQSVPEPTSYAVLLAGFGAIAFVLQRRERRRRNSILAE